MVEWLTCTLFPQYALVRIPSIEKFAVNRSPELFFCQSDRDVMSQVHPLARYCNLYFKQLWSVNVNIKGIYFALLMEQIVWL
jgi:hypothetical protein